MRSVSGILILSVILCIAVGTGCGDGDGDGQLSAEPDCAGPLVDIADVAPGERDQAEAVRLILGSLGMGELAESVPEQVPTYGSDGFVALDDARVVYAEDGRTLGVFSAGGGRVCHSLQEKYYAFP